MEAYRPRAVRYAGLWEEEGWRLKVYEITLHRGAPDPTLVRAARDVVRAALPRPALAPGRPGVGFVGIHEGAGDDVVFLDWWASGNELHHRLWRTHGRRPVRLAPGGAGDLTGCVWDLGVLAFERRCWIDAVLSTPSDVDAYLSCHFTGVM